MTRDDIIRVAIKAAPHLGEPHSDMIDTLTLFAALVAEDVREACAKVCDGLDTPKAIWSISRNCADAIRAEGKA